MATTTTTIKSNVTAIKSVYKRWTGTAWEAIAFYTHADLVQETTSKVFLRPATHTVNGKTFLNGTTHQGIILAGADINYTGDTGNYVTKDSTLNAAIKALDTAAKAAYDAIPSGVLTTSNYGTTLDSVYQPLDADLTSIAGLTGTSGFLKKTAANTWSLDTNTYLTTSGKAADADKLDGHDSSYFQTAISSTNKIPYSNISDTPTIPTTLPANDVYAWAKAANKPSYSATEISYSSGVSVKSKIDDVVAVANGKTNTYVIDHTEYSATNPPSGTTVCNDIFNSNDESVGYSSSTAFSAKSLSLKGGGFVKLSDLKVGDVILVTETDVPDRWYDGTYGFYKMETAKVPINDYVLKTAGVTGVTWDSTNKKLTKTINGSTTDVVGISTIKSALSLAKADVGLGNVENTALSTWTGSSNLTTAKVGTLAAAAVKGVDTSISAASTSTNLPTSAAVAAFVEGKGYKTTDNNTTYTFATGTTAGAFSVTPSGGTATSVSIYGLGGAAYKAYSTAVASGEDKAISSGAVYTYVTNRANKITVGNTAPTSNVTNDIWIDTN